VATAHSQEESGEIVLNLLGRDAHINLNAGIS
jgi:hypothetical protein